eukprot:CAMPEP_0171224594 /NCGR_PEP_ID=MMETSP0790-20130122/36370_1 /TAXON_ID=2925 /ORGANISM="Alexandrium catenella, Strain OF101" /LENGTH=52 /DNA_ID=CAMNT_0011690597 /DNA_START=74 /DNA_END=232 /DNA_ORIENTATION=-
MPILAPGGKYFHSSRAALDSANAPLLSAAAAARDAPKRAAARPTRAMAASMP